MKTKQKKRNHEELNEGIRAAQPPASGKLPPAAEERTLSGRRPKEDSPENGERQGWKRGGR